MVPIVGGITIIRFRCRGWRRRGGGGDEDGLCLSSRTQLEVKAILGERDGDFSSRLCR